MEELSNTVKEEEIDLIGLTRVILKGKRLIVKVSGIFVLLGIIIAILTPSEYRSRSILIPEALSEDVGLSGSLGGLASLAGVDLKGSAQGSVTINPTLYQSVSESTPFLLELMQQKYFFGEIGKEITLYDYYLNHYDIGLIGKIISVPSSILSWVKGFFESEEGILEINDNLIYLTKEEQGFLEDLQSRISVEMDWDLNIVNIRVEMQDPVVSALMVKYTQKYITNYVTQYAISKSRQQLESIEKQYQERKNGFEQAQIRLASFRDGNQNVTTARAKSEEERLQSEYNLSFNVYNQLAQQREAIRLQIQKDTPVFTVLEPAKVPVDKESPKRLLILFFSIVVGIFVSLMIIFFKDMVIELIKEFNDPKAG